MIANAQDSALYQVQPLMLIAPPSDFSSRCWDSTC